MAGEALVAYPSDVGAVASSSWCCEPTTKVQQILIRFQNVTHVVYVPTYQQSRCWKSRLLQLWSERTGWPVQYLRLSGGPAGDCYLSLSSDCVWFDITVRSSIRGGKGGFGTLLKGQSRQAGAKLTTDFGACRDLQGRRLRHVNDEIKLRKWREAEERKKQRKQGGNDEDEKEDDYLWNTPSGLYNWHLLTPTWADLSKKAINRSQRHYKYYEQKQKRKQLTKAEEEKRILDESLKHYVGKTNEVVETIQQSIGSAVQQGLQAQKAAAAAHQAKKRKRQEEVLQQQQQSLLDGNQQLSSLVTLSGDVVVVDSSESPDTDAETVEKSAVGVLQMQAKSDFATAVFVLDQKQQPKQRLYYEIELVTGGLAQIGWANLVATMNEESQGNGDDKDGTSKAAAAVFEPNNDEGDGVGDDASSFAFDGSRCLKFHGGTEEPYGESLGDSSNSSSWKAGDILGCIYDANAGTISYSLNGESLGVAFKLTPRQQETMVLFPAVSCNEGEILAWRVRKDDFKYFPSDGNGVVTAVHELTLDPSSKSATMQDATAEACTAVSAESTNEVDATDDSARAGMALSGSSSTSKATGTQVPSPQLKSAPPAKPEALDLELFKSAQQLEELGLDRLKSALMALQVKCG